MNRQPGTRSTGSPGRLRLAAFGFITMTCIAAAAVYLVHAGKRVKAVAGSTTPIDMVETQALPAGAGTSDRSNHGARWLMFRSTALGPSHGRIGYVSLDGSVAPRAVSSLHCERVHFASGVGLCLEARRTGVVSYHAQIFDDRFNVRHSIPLPGTPSRARVSRDGRLVAFTVFVSGHSYNSPGFATRTAIYKADDGQPIVGDLETWEVRRNGQPFRSVDFNFWGVTFAPDSRRFFATLATAGTHYMVEGDIATRQMRVVREGIECPSLSPDGRRVAFKRRAPMDAAGRSIWRVVVLDLHSGAETLLDKELRNVDDQVEWLNDREIVYGMPQSGERSSAGTDLWALDASGTSASRLLVPFAWSPAAMP